jgi:hypothetical protein
MRMTTVLCGCAVLTVGCISSPFEPSYVDLPHHYANTRLGAADPTPAAGQGIDAKTIALASASTPDDFVDRGWECRNSPVPGRVVCSRPNQTFPVPAFPPDVPPADRAVTVTLLAWENGSFAGTIVLIRPEIYRGQPCSSTGEAYVFRPIIGYYECLNRVGR